MVVMGYTGCDRGYGPETDGFVVVRAEDNVMAMLGIRYAVFTGRSQYCRYTINKCNACYKLSRPRSHISPLILH